LTSKQEKNNLTVETAKNVFSHSSFGGSVTERKHLIFNYSPFNKKKFILYFTPFNILFIVL